MNAQTIGDIQFYDEHPKPVDFYAEVMHGLQRMPKLIPPKFFYDEVGSRLFDAICEVPEYYPTRTEMALLYEHAEEIAALIGKECLLIEPGSGSSQKVRLLLDALQPAAYMPMDISRTHLLNAAQQLSEDYPWLEVHATCIDFTTEMKLRFCPPSVHKVAFFPGSSIGNFEPIDAIGFLRNMANMVGAGGGLLIGVDLKKDHGILNAAYNDAEGITAQFNLNLLSRINHELDGKFDIDSFQHKAFYNPHVGRIEMHLSSRDNQVVKVGDKVVNFDKAETIHTENSYKYTVEEFSGLARAAGFDLVSVWTDSDDLFSLHYYQVN
jgi:dimethylhistidine N-methyltransferase